MVWDGASGKGRRERKGRIAPRFALPRSCEHSQSAGPLPRFLLMYGGVTKPIAKQNARRTPNIAVLMGRQNRSQRDLREEAKRVALRPVPQPHTRLRDFSRPLRPRLYASIGACAKPGTFCLMRCGREAERLVFMRVWGAESFVSLGAFGGAAICLTIS